MKIVQADAIIIQNVVGQLLRKPVRPDLAKSIAILFTEVEKVVNQIRETFKPVDGWKEYQGKRQAILDKHGTPQPNGSFNISNDGNKKLSSLANKYKDLVSEQEQYSKDYQAESEKTLVDIDFDPINIEVFDFNIEPGILVELIRCGILKRSVENGHKQGDI